MAELGEANIGGRMVPAWLLNLTAEELDSLKSRWYSNPNLLDNWYFANLVNQRGQTSYTGSGYGIDRWKSGNSNLTVNLTGEGIELISGSAASYFSQYFDPGITSDGSYTISALVKAISGTAYFQAIYSDGTYGNAMKLAAGLNVLTVKAAKTISRVLFQVNSGSSVTVNSAKLELGSQQTLAHLEGDKWVLNEVPDYGEQLRRCQRYFVNFNPYKMAWFSMPPAVTGAVSTGEVKAFSAVPLPVAMRAQPTVSYGGKIVLSQTNDVQVTDIRVSSGTFAGNYLQLMYVAAGGLTANSLYRVQGGNDTTSYIWLSADL